MAQSILCSLVLARAMASSRASRVSTAQRAPWTGLKQPAKRSPSSCNVVLLGNQKHFRWTIVGPLSSYSCFEIHICWKVDSDDRIDPPIHTEYLRSGGAMTLIFIVDGARAVSSFVPM